ncbi:Putative ubiquitin-protein ligase [Klebsormidium nitens]|uniref:Putative ubiquitin-protein ligase n=1 Tax=Klebsormidium nitens TaxID=105231 RepID=A0A1Y1IGK4_KLENI|nr:Putative ubiquitin-protein ligase [Klebsormidium nitens]|eukprot:GAQ89192.1 Putative ubiquitin-protein ligase [Klebsormidium nitens]
MASVLAESAPLSQPSFSFIKPNPLDGRADSGSALPEKEVGEPMPVIDGPKKIFRRSLTPRLEYKALLSRAVFTYAWGRGDLGQLGLGVESNVDVPTLVKALAERNVVHAAAAEYHSAFLTSDGELYTSGSNDTGQLGVKGRESAAEPVRVAALDTYTITHVACGRGHTVAVTDQGALAAWGEGDQGQLGHRDAMGSTAPVQPKIVKGTRELRFVRVACGAAHTLALTGSGEVYSFGQGQLGALGHGDLETKPTPTLVDSLWGLAIVQVAAGENHSAALTVDGQIFTWGRNKYGQLGHSDGGTICRPTRLNGLSNEGVVHVACGGDHTLAITRKGELYTWGRGRWGQCGHGTTDDTFSPTLVTGLPKGVRVAHASAGTRHTLAVLEKGDVYGWGDGELCQLGPGVSGVQTTPVKLQGLPQDKRLLFLVAGGDHNIAVFSQSQQPDKTVDLEVVLEEVAERSERPHDGAEPMDTSEHPTTDAQPEPTPSTESTRPAESAPPSEPSSEPAAARSSSSDDRFAVAPFEQPRPLEHHGAGLRPITMPPLLQMLEADIKPGREMSILGNAIEDFFSSGGFLEFGFREHGPPQPEASTSGRDSETPPVDVEAIKRVYDRILKLYDTEMIQRLGNSTVRLLDGLAAHAATVPSERWAKIPLILMQSPLLGMKGLGDLSSRLFGLIAQLPHEVHFAYVRWFRTYPKDIFAGRFVRSAKNYIDTKQNMIAASEPPADDIAAAVMVLRLLYKANTLGGRPEILPYADFHSITVSQKAALREEYRRWRQVEGAPVSRTKRLVSYCQVPWLLTPEAKSEVLQGEANLQKTRELHNWQLGQIFGGNSAPFLILQVRRSHIVPDALAQLGHHTFDLKKPLKVVFVGEEAIDEGGVTKEFFQLVVRELFDVRFGMFTYDDESREFWFSQTSMESESEFHLVGIILGLAIYNSVILDVHLPLVVYKKLLGGKPTLEDLKDARPAVGRSLQKLLDFEGDVESAFGLDFQVSYENFGAEVIHDLITNGGQTPVTNANRQQYVELYVKYVLEESIQTQFDAFRRGFLQVCGGPALSLFRHEELELLVCGLPHFDFDALSKEARYEAGFTKDSPVIKWFWELVKAMSLDEKKKLLFFTTGSSRAPIGGLSELRFVVQRMGPDTDRLPTAHTCFNVLLLPEYATKEKLADRLHLAIKNAEGFGLQ